MSTSVHKVDHLIEIICRGWNHRSSIKKPPIIEDTKSSMHNIGMTRAGTEWIGEKTFPLTWTAMPGNMYE